MINELIKLATHLDEKGLAKEADYLDAIIKKAATPSGWGFRTEGDEASKVWDVFDLYVFKRGYPAYKKLEALGKTDPMTIIFDIADGKVAATVDPKTTKLTTAANEIVAIIKATKSRDTKESIISAVYRDVRKKKGPLGREKSGKKQEHWEAVDVKRPPARVIISTVKK